MSCPQCMPALTMHHTPPSKQEAAPSQSWKPPAQPLPTSTNRHEAAHPTQGRNPIRVLGVVITAISSIRLMVQKSCDHQLRLVVYPIFYRVLYIPGGCLGFLPSTVSLNLIHRIVAMPSTDKTLNKISGGYRVYPGIPGYTRKHLGVPVFKNKSHSDCKICWSNSIISLVKIKKSLRPPLSHLDIYISSHHHT